MKPIPSRTQFWLVGLAYGAVSVFAAAVLYARHLQELQNPIDAAGGMWAAGDAILGLFIVGLFMIPTAFLIWVLAKFEGFYTSYSLFLLILSASAPVCLGLLFIGESRVGEGVINFCLYRLVASPFILGGMGVSRLVARFDRAKRFAAYALLIEAVSFATSIGWLVYEIMAKRH